LVHTSSLPVMTWQELQAWIEAKPEVKKSLPKERNLFGDDQW
jgi:hypothetical protein